MITAGTKVRLKSDPLNYNIGVVIGCNEKHNLCWIHWESDEKQIRHESELYIYPDQE